MSSPSGSCWRIARNAVGAVKSVHDAVLGADAPEGARVGRADRLALVEDARAAVQQRAVDGVGVPDRPADVRRGPVHLARVGVVDVLHRPRERDRMAAVVADDPLRLPGRPGRVDDVERVRRERGGRSRPARRPRARRATRGRASDRARPRASAAGGRCSAPASTRSASMAASRSGLYATTRPGSIPHEARHDDLRLRVLDRRRELVRREPAEDDRVDGADPGAREHRDRPPRGPSACRRSRGRPARRPRAASAPAKRATASRSSR